MKLLFDENLSPKLAETLSSDYPNSTHVRTLGLLGASDHRIWNYAREHGYTIVSKDTDFRERSFVDGFPPKVIWLDIGNASTKTIENLLRQERQLIQAFEQQQESSFLIVSPEHGSL